MVAAFNKLASNKEAKSQEITIEEKKQQKKKPSVCRGFKEEQGMRKKR